MQISDPNTKLKLALKIVIGIIFLLILSLVLVLVFSGNNENETKKPNGETIENGENGDEKTTILNIPAMDTKDAFRTLDILVEQYGEPNPQGLIAILEELREEETPTFKTVTWRDIKYGYDLTFNFWTDGSLARKDTFYFTGHKGKGNTIDELFDLVNIQKDSDEFIFNIIDLGGAVFNVGITPNEVARTPEPITQEEIDELSKEEILQILEENSKKEYPNDVARAKLEYENQLKDYNWVIRENKYPDIMEKARRDWGHNYVMVRWQYEKEVRAHESTIQ